MEKNKNAKQTDHDQKKQGKSQSNAPRKNEPTAHAEQRGRGTAQHQPTAQQRPSDNSAQSDAQQTGKTDQTITNQDEQRQTTNAGSSDKPMGEEETEGDRQREQRLKPYKNVGDDSGETEKKEPTMK